MKEGAVERLFRLREETYRKVLLYLMLCGSDPVLTNQAKLARAIDLTRFQARHAVDYLEAEGFISVSRGKDEAAISIIGLAIDGSAIDDDMNRFIIDIEDDADTEHKPEHNVEHMHEHNVEHMHEHNVEHMHEHKQETGESVTPIDDIVLPEHDVEHKPEHKPEHMHEHNVEHMHEHNVEHMHEHKPGSDADSHKEANHVSDLFIYNNTQKEDLDLLEGDLHKEQEKEINKEKEQESRTEKDQTILESIKSQSTVRLQAIKLYELYMNRLRGGQKGVAVRKIEDLLTGAHYAAKNRTYSVSDLLEAILSYVEDINGKGKAIMYKPETFFGRDLVFQGYLPGALRNKDLEATQAIAMSQREEAADLYALYSKHVRSIGNNVPRTIQHIESILAGRHEKCQGRPRTKDELIEAMVAYKKSKANTEEKYRHASHNFFGTEAIVFRWLDHKDGTPPPEERGTSDESNRNRIEVDI